MKERGSPWLILFVLAVFLVIYRGNGEKIYRTGDGCFAHERGSVELVTNNPFANGNNPSFQIPFPLPTIGTGDAETKTGLSVRYTKSSQNYRDHRNRSFKNLPRECVLVPAEAELMLVRLRPTEIPKVKGNIRCRERRHRDEYIPKNLDTSYGAVHIYCGDRGLACRMSNAMENGWKANIMLPKEGLHLWKDAADAADNFFQSKLRDCGKK
ncbi:MAG: hypothetical protein ABJR46_17010 [Tateyamaria sp.]|uniref:hypothetical protein n=1 Tax=Tateyamaria sp. TaxID=1929288 RepID=UPI00329DB1EE